MEEMTEEIRELKPKGEEEAAEEGEEIAKVKKSQ